MELNNGVGKHLGESATRIHSHVSDPYDVTFSDIVRPYQEIATADVGIVGIPFDTCTLQRRGGRFGPTGIREMLANANTYEAGLGVDLSSNISVADFGDIDVLLTDPIATHGRVTEVLSAIHQTGVIPIALGGDHSLTFPCIRALCNATVGRVGVIVFDGHFDVRESMHGELNSGTSFRRIFTELEGSRIWGANVVEIGISGWYNSNYFYKYTQEMGMTIFPAREVHLRGISPVIEEALVKATDGVDALYCSVDIDCLEAAFAPGTSIPSPGGMTSFQLLEAVYTIARHPKLRAFDVMEVAPPLDYGNLTSRIGANVVMQMIGGLKTRKDERQKL
jgi:formimidoylglutamase